MKAACCGKNRMDRGGIGVTGRRKRKKCTAKSGRPGTPEKTLYGTIWRVEWTVVGVYL